MADQWIVFGLHIQKTTTVGDLAQTIAVIVAFITLAISLWHFRKTLKESNKAIGSADYSELDQFYAEILKMAIERPYLRAPAPIRDDADALEADYRAYPQGSEEKHGQYDAYAYIVWNFLETIHDRCWNNQELKGTWEPVIAAENRIHRGWFLGEMRKAYWSRTEQDNKSPVPDKFCEGFQIFVYEKQWNDSVWQYRDKFPQEPYFGKRPGSRAQMTPREPGEHPAAGLHAHAPAVTQSLPAG